MSLQILVDQQAICNAWKSGSSFEFNTCLIDKTQGIANIAHRGRIVWPVSKGHFRRANQDDRWIEELEHNMWFGKCMYIALGTHSNILINSLIRAWKRTMSQSTAISKLSMIEWRTLFNAWLNWAIQMLKLSFTIHLQIKVWAFLPVTFQIKTNSSCRILCFIINASTKKEKISFNSKVIKKKSFLIFNHLSNLCKMKIPRVGFEPTILRLGVSRPIH